jgi:homogentisate 1,2-dioxygenase
MYRIRISLEHAQFSLLEPAPPAPSKLTPSSFTWPSFPTVSSEQHSDWTKQHLFAGNGDAPNRTGFAVRLFNITQDMPDRAAFSSLDGDELIIVPSGALDIRTELGCLLVRQNEIAVTPRGFRYRVALVNNAPTRGYVFELFYGHFRLPSLGVIGTSGLASTRDFQIATARYDGSLVDGIAQLNDKLPVEWAIIVRQAGALWSCT